MRYRKTVILKNGKNCLLREADTADGAEMSALFLRTHAETEFLLTLPEESSMTPEQESEFLHQAAESAEELELAAFVDGRMVGSAGIDCPGHRMKQRHRAEFGISVLKAYWGLGIGRALTEAAVACAKQAGYTQLELQAVAENEKALALYESVGFREFGRNPRGFRMPDGRYQTLVLMRLELQ